MININKPLITFVISLLGIAVSTWAQADALTVAANGDIGIGTDTPAFDLDIVRSGQIVMQLDDTTGEKWALVVNSTGPREGFSLTRVGSGIREFRVDNSGNFIIEGSLVSGGGGLCDPGPCDRTFTHYTLESIEEHADFMWDNSYLWGVGPTPDDQPINVTHKVTGILHELEKAHIYIDQLNSQIKSIQQGHENVMRVMEERLKNLENALSHVSAK